MKEPMKQISKEQTPRKIQAVNFNVKSAYLNNDGEKVGHVHKIRTSISKSPMPKLTKSPMNFPAQIFHSQDIDNKNKQRHGSKVRMTIQNVDIKNKKLQIKAEYVKKANVDHQHKRSGSLD